MHQQLLASTQKQHFPVSVCVWCDVCIHLWGSVWNIN